MVLLLVAALLCLQIPSVQTRAISRLTDSLNEKIDGTLTVGKVHLLPFNTLVAQDITLTDRHPVDSSFFAPRDTLAHIDHLSVSFALRDLLSMDNRHVAKATVHGGRLNLVIEGRGKNNLKRVLGLGQQKKEPKDGAFSIKKVDVKDFRFTMANIKGEEKYTPGYEGMDWMDLDVMADAKASDIKIGGGAVAGHIDGVSILERSGYSAWGICGDVFEKDRKVQVHNFELHDHWSDIALDRFAMSWNHKTDFRDFCHKVPLELKMNRTLLDFRSLSYFAPLPNMTTYLDISEAEAQGIINSLNIKSLSFREDGGLSGTVAARIDNLCDFGALNLDSKLNGVKFTTSSLQHFIHSIAPGTPIAIAAISPGESFVLDGNLSGPGNDLTLDCTLNSTAGALSGSVNARNLLDKSKPTRFKGSVNTSDLIVGKFAGTDLVKECTMRTTLDAEIDGKSTSLSVDSLYIDRLHLLGYDYSDIAAAGTFLDNSFNGRIICSDPNLNFIFQGIFNLSQKTKNALYKFYFNLGYADLNAINLDKRGPSKASTAVNANFMRIEKGDLIGNIDIKGLTLENSEGVHNIGNAAISSLTSGASHKINFASTFAEASYVGTKAITGLIDAVKQTTVLRELPSLDKSGPEIWEPEEYKIRFKTYDSRDLLSFVLPGLYVADGTTASINIDREGTMNSSLSSQRIAFRNKYLKNLWFTAKDNGDTLKVSLDGKELSLGGGVKLLDNRLTMNADSDRINLDYRFDNGSDERGKGRLKAECDVSRDENDSLQFAVRTLRSGFSINSERWEIMPSSALIKSKDYIIDSLAIVNGKQSASLHGGLSKENTDTLRVNLEKFNLGSLQGLVAKLPDMGGFVSGKAMILSPYGQKAGLLANLTGEDISVSGYDAGEVSIRSAWNEKAQSMDFLMKNDIGGSSTINAAGSYKPGNGDIRAKVKMNGLEMGYLSSFVKSIFSELEGKINGEVGIVGRTGNLSIYSRDAYIDNGLVKVAYTNVPYYLDGPFHIDDHGLTFDSVDIRDRSEGSGTMTGGITFNRLKNIRMDTDIRVRDIEVFDTADDGVAPIYGKLNASGDIGITGPFSSITMNVEARTSGDGDFHIPLRDNGISAGTNLLTFKERESTGWIDPYEAMMNESGRGGKQRGHFGLNMLVGVRPEVQCHLELDKESGNVLTGRGYGNLSVVVGGKERPLDINGDYSLNSGNFHFNAMNIATRNFSINNGSSIKFNGDIMESSLDIGAKYTTKASLANLIADTTSVTSRRNVECSLNISDKLKNPQISFDLDIPDLDPSTKSLVESALNTEDKVQKQFLALLVTNSFLPDEQSGIVNNSDILVSNVMEIMSGQLNNILQKLQIPLDLGLKYQSNEGGTDIFDVAVSTQLFNNRVSVNGNIGNRQYNAGNTQQEIAGDLDIEMKVDKAGAVRVSLFSHSADQYSNYLDYSQRNGIGIGYQKEFNTLKGFFRDMFTPREKRMSRRGDTPRNEKITIKIQPEDE